MHKLPAIYFQQKDTVQLAKDLLGKILITDWDGQLTSGRIVETEAYLGATDRASHAYGGRRTARTEIMYLPGGYAYVYLCYGLHHLFNVVTHHEGVPHAILIRAVEPIAGIQVMLYRRNKKDSDASLTRGPGSVAQALGIKKHHSGHTLQSDYLYLADEGNPFKENEIGISPRIGVDYAGEDAFLPYRFFIKNHPSVSGKNR
jgi:DNA-3-methyladenine glycosylase